ncbi:MAG TPA: choice-of-anchor tandem repeat GloVer-containing protein, partial [Tepidisphaeraceae bacterium]
MRAKARQFGPWHVVAGLGGTRIRLAAGRAARNLLEETTGAEFGPRPSIEQLENRLFLSGYTLSDLGQLGINATGANPRSALVADADGNLFATTSAGGSHGAGTVFEIAHGSNVITALASFNGSNGAIPYAGVTLDPSGDIFGTTFQGGAYNDGTVFEIAKGSNAITTLGSFNYYTSGANPSGEVVLDGSGNLYGTTTAGGASYDGTVFEIASGSTTFTTITSLNSNTGSGPEDGVTLDGLGDLYGTTSQGGAYECGTAFEIVAGSGTATALASFNGVNGKRPEAGVTFGAAGDLFGTTSLGGANNDGTVFEIAKGTNTITTLASFNGTDGLEPWAAVILDPSGNLYGTASGGGDANEGTAFEIAQGSSAITTLVSFNETIGGLDPLAAVMADSSGNLYGTTYSGGTGGNGTVFVIAKGSNSCSLLASFDGTNAADPYGGVALDASGNLYGTTYAGGINGLGTLFEVAEGSNAVTTLVSFDGANGSYPESAPTLDGTGNLYGTTAGGGSYGYGTVYELVQGSDTIATLASFNGADGEYPAAGLAMDALGNIFGITKEGGTYGDGTVFEIRNGSSTVTTLASLDSFDSGMFSPGVSLDTSGNIYGTTQEGGAYGHGRVFEIANSSTAITTLASFDSADGEFPESGVTVDPSGNLYGTTQQGGAYAVGTLFEIARGSNAITTLASFKGGIQSGAGPLSLDASGNLFGTTFDGTVFELAKGSTTITTLVSFNGIDGANPRSGVAIDAVGDLYGTTASGGPGNAGTVFQLAVNSAIALALTGGSNPSTSNQSLTYTARISGGVPDGETVTLVDASNNNASVATGTLSGGTATLTVLADTLSPGTHNLIAAYAGDANFAASESIAYAQVVSPPPLPGWLAAGSQVTWDASTHTLTVTGAAVINADPGADEPNIVESGTAARLVIQPATSPTDIHVGGISLSNGAKLQVASVGASRTHSNHNVLVVGTPGAANDPT